MKSNRSETLVFMVQFQVNLLENEISYHNFPDQNVIRTGIGSPRGSASTSTDVAPEPEPERRDPLSELRRQLAD